MQNLDQNRLIAGRYRLRQSLGKGSFGEVFYAEDIQFNPPRGVALKLLHPQYLTDEQVREDLRHEASVLARFDHPNILRIIDFGINPDVAFIVTDVAQGGSLAHRLRPNPTQPPVMLPLGEVASYLEQIADALDEAHSQGLVHRDIKPQNILLDRRNRPMLADFGLAAAVSGTSSSMMVDTSTSGTPLYMAPEQWQGRAGRSSDIYALGAVVYQMITGGPPYLGNQYELLGQHLNSPIPRLSERAPNLHYPPALDGVIAAALAKDPHQRIRPAKELAQQFRTVVTRGQDITVPIPVIKRPAPTDSSASGSVSSASQNGTLPLGDGSSSNPVSNSTPPEGHTANIGSVGFNQQESFTQAFNAYSGPANAANRQQPLTNSVTATPPPASYYTNPPVASQPEKPRKRPIGLWLGLLVVLLIAIAVVAVVLLTGNKSSSTQVATQPTSTTLATTTQAVPATTISVASTTSVATTIAATSVPDTTLAVTAAPATTTVAAPTYTPAPTVPAYGSLLATLTNHTAIVLSVAFSPDGTTLATASQDDTVELWDVTTNPPTLKPVHIKHDQPIRSVAFSPNGKLLASGSADNTVKVWDVANGQEVANLAGPDGHTKSVTSVAFSPDGKTLASASDDTTVKIWDLSNSKVVHTLSGHGASVTSVAFSPDGKTLASGSFDRNIILWDVAGGNLITTLQGHNAEIWSVAFSPDGKTLASGSFDHTIKIWNLTDHTNFNLSNYAKGVRQVTFSPNGKYLAAGSDDLEQPIEIWDVALRQSKVSLKGDSDIVYSVAFSPDGYTLASGSADKTVRLWSLK